MKCDMCGNRNSVIHVQQIMGSETIELHLCEACAREKGIRGSEDKIEVSLSHLLTGLVDVKPRSSRQEEKKSCARCGTSFGSFRRSGRFGCPDCLTEFRREISTLLDKMAAPAQHRGKYPRRLLTYKRFFVDREKLKHRLQSALTSEDYEKAASIRDEIRRLEESAEGQHD